MNLTNLMNTKINAILRTLYYDYNFHFQVIIIYQLTNKEKFRENQIYTNQRNINIKKKNGKGMK